MKYHNGKYEGDWVNNCYEGNGVLTHTLEDRAGYSYRGEWWKGVKHGKGSIVYVSGYKYTGEWTNDKANGEEKLSYPRSVKPALKGRWRVVLFCFLSFIVVLLPLPSSPCVLSLLSPSPPSYLAIGYSYSGAVDAAGAPHGRSTAVYTTGDSYTGAMVYVNMGNRYEGGWTTDLQDGQWQARKKTGQGTLVWRNGSRCYKGGWRNDRAEGDGIMEREK